MFIYITRESKASALQRKGLGFNQRQVWYDSLAILGLYYFYNDVV